ncbi:hypothetical protein K377_08188, partial [Streptomyces sp. PsTaAH-137]
RPSSPFTSLPRQDENPSLYDPTEEPGGPAGTQ